MKKVLNLWCSIAISALYLAAVLFSGPPQVAHQHFTLPNEQTNTYLTSVSYHAINPATENQNSFAGIKKTFETRVNPSVSEIRGFVIFPSPVLTQTFKSGYLYTTTFMVKLRTSRLIFPYHFFW
ncbi:MAG: hypothetical protein IPM34_06755 [Saprospiraceae bacterium]|nr:hypothetical protein [Saprospiraceae bacterium]